MCMIIWSISPMYYTPNKRGYKSLSAEAIWVMEMNALGRLEGSRG